MVTTVTNGGWSVSTTFGASPGFRLNVRKHLDPAGRRIRRGDHDGRVFWHQDEATAFALERGYLQPFRRVAQATFRQVHRAALRRLHRDTVRRIRAASTLADLIDIANDLGPAIRNLAGHDDTGWLVGLTWSAGFWSAVNRLRPELVARASHAAEPVA